MKDNRIFPLLNLKNEYYSFWRPLMSESPIQLIIIVNSDPPFGLGKHHKQIILSGEWKKDTLACTPEIINKFNDHCTECGCNNYKIYNGQQEP